MFLVGLEWRSIWGLGRDRRIPEILRPYIHDGTSVVLLPLILIDESISSNDQTFMLVHDIVVLKGSNLHSQTDLNN
jgi:hypothetical protein